MPFPQRKYEGDFPPEVAKLVLKHKGNVSAAERAAGISPSTFSKMRAGKVLLTNFYKQRVLAALNPEGTDMTTAKPPAPPVPEKCPPLIAQLIEFTGSKKQAIKVLGTSDGTFYPVINGNKEMPPAWIIKAKAAMGQPVIGPSTTAEPDGPEVPSFALWDGKAIGTIDIAGRGGQKGRKVKNVPEPLVRLFEKGSSNMTVTSRMLNSSPNTVLKLMEDPKTFTERWQRKVHDVLHSVAPAFSAQMGADADKYTLDLAIVTTKGVNFDRINDIADLLNARLIFRKNTGAGWLLIYKMLTPDLPKFKKIAMRDATEIVCP